MIPPVVTPDGSHRGRLLIATPPLVDPNFDRTVVLFTSDHGGTVPATAVQGRVIDNYTVPVLLGVAALLGLRRARGGSR